MTRSCGGASSGAPTPKAPSPGYEGEPEEALGFDLQAEGLGADDKAQMVLCSTNGLMWLNVRITAEAAGNAFDVEATDGTGISARAVPRRRLRLADQTQPEYLDDGADVDAIHQGKLRPATVLHKVERPNTYALQLKDGGDRLDDVPRDAILALHA